MYEPRLYQQAFNKERFRLFRVSWKETELLVGVDHRSWHESMPEKCTAFITGLRRKLQAYISLHPAFQTSHEPVKALLDAPQEVQEMCSAGYAAGTGPMASVAGLFAEKTGENLLGEYGCREVFVENGGDLFLKLENDLVYSVFAGSSPLSGKLGVLLPPGVIGLCTSSGTVGHSFSYGKADAVTVACASAPLADALATAIANKISGPSDIQSVLEEYATLTDIRSLLAVCGDKAGIRGEFTVLPVKN
ncbi:MAG: UPF0280 family protein [Bacteroidota bacterium]